MSEWKAADIQKQVLNALAVRLASLGYAGPKGQSFHRIIPGGRTTFHVAFIRHSSDLDVTAHVACRLDALQNLLLRYESSLSNVKALETASFGAELGRIAGTGQKRWTIRNGMEVSDVADSLVREFETVGVPYLTRYCEAEVLLTALSQDDGSASVLFPIPSARYTRAVGLALLLERPALVEELIRKGTEHLRAKPEWEQQGFARFSEWIRDEQKRLARA